MGVKGEGEGGVPRVTRACEARAPGIVVGCAELVTVESWRADDAPTLSSHKVAGEGVTAGLSHFAIHAIHACTP